MKKLVSIALVTVVAALSLTACGNDGGSAEDSSGDSIRAVQNAVHAVCEHEGGVKDTLPLSFGYSDTNPTEGVVVTCENHKQHTVKIHNG